MAAPSEAELSSSQRDSLAQYREVTAQEVEPAIRLLHSTGWDVVAAISSFFEHGPEPRVNPPPLTRPVETRPTATELGIVRSRRNNRERGALIPAVRVESPSNSQMATTIRPPFLLGLLLAPFGIIFGLLGRFLRTIGFFMPALPRLLARLTAGTVFSQMFNQELGASTVGQSNSLGTRKALVGRDASERVVRNFCEVGLIEKECPIRFYQDSYSSAFEAARRESRFLIVILISYQNDSTAPYIQQTLLSHEILRLIGADSIYPDLLVWVGDVRDAEAFQVMDSLTVTSLPFFGIVAPVQVQAGGSGMSQLFRSQGFAPASKLAVAVTTALQRFHDSLSDQRRRNQELEQARNIRERQDADYKASLQMDRELEEKAAFAAFQREEAARAEKERVRQKEIHVRNRSQWLRWKTSQLLVSKIHIPDGTNVVKLRLQLPQGTPQIREFPPDLSITDLYAVIDCLILHSQETSDTDVVVSAPEGYVHKYEFRMIQPGARGALEPDSMDAISKQLGRMARLIIEKFEDEADDGVEIGDDGNALKELHRAQNSVLT